MNSSFFIVGFSVLLRFLVSFFFDVMVTVPFSLERA
jgi:hypothetical protein